MTGDEIVSEPKRVPFGGRFLKEDDDVFKHNAWLVSFCFKNEAEIRGINRIGQKNSRRTPSKSYLAKKKYPNMKKVSISTCLISHLSR